MYIPLKMAARTSTTIEFPATRYLAVFDSTASNILSIDPSSCPISLKHSRGVRNLNGGLQLNYAPPHMGYRRRDTVGVIDPLVSVIVEICDQSDFHYTNLPLAFRKSYITFPDDLCGSVRIAWLTLSLSGSIGTIPNPFPFLFWFTACLLKLATCSSVR